MKLRTVYLMTHAAHQKNKCFKLFYLDLSPGFGEER